MSMQTVVENINSYSKKLKVDISSQELTPLEQQILRNYQRRSEIPGFRPGKAPLNIVKKRHGDLIQQELIEEALRMFYRKALEEAKIIPVAEGKITNLTFADIQSGMQIEIEVEVEPEIELKKYKGLKVEKDIVEVTDEMVGSALEQLRERYATIKEVDQAEQGHYVYFNAQELDSGDVPLVGKKYENLQANLGKGEFDQDIEIQLNGVRKGEKRIVRKEIPADPTDKKSQPQVTSLEIHVIKIEEKEFPELNDDFVKNLDDENIADLKQLKERIYKNIELDIANRSEQIFQQRLIDELLKENPFEVPPTMVENYLQEMIKDIEKQSKEKSIDEESLRKEYRASAIHNLRWHFLKKKLIQSEKISVSDEEALSMIENSGLDEKVKKQAKNDQHYLGHLKEDLLERKTIEILKNNAEITEIFPMKQSVSEINKT
jgi:trigger factor